MKKPLTRVSIKTITKEFSAPGPMTVLSKTNLVIKSSYGTKFDGEICHMCGEARSRIRTCRINS